LRAGPNPYPRGSEAYWLHAALEQALGGLGWTSPNPAVGCVLVRNGTLVGQGFHARDGEAHAEEAALRSCADARGATAYVTLEPCSVEARRPSCCRLLAAAGVAAVVYGALDSDPRSAGQAQAALAAAGIDARPPHGEGAAAAAAACRRFLDAYAHARTRQTPFLQLKLALSLDAKLATANGSSQWLSGPVSHGLAHYLRQSCDAVLVGYRTALIDNPRLTVRPEVMAAYRPLPARLRQPARIVLDPCWQVLARLAVSGESPLALADLSGPFRSSLPRLVLVGYEQDPPPKPAALPGVELIRLPRAPQLDWGLLRALLWGLGIRSVLVEGGAGVAQRLLAQRQVDKLTCVYTPRLLGSDGLGFSPPLGLTAIAGGMHLEDALVQDLDGDALLCGYPRWPTAIC
jgi:diaminohydroxyphosphoribosylaminopyrimidine deaminase/5-amino-6-(5-phosphoribosylamino)uracil reductase